MMKPIVIAGGSGSRLWPLSRALYPKQFLPLASDQTMLQATLARIDGLCDGAPTVICNEEHRFIVAEQLRSQAEGASIILEPAGRNTAPAIALAALESLNKDEDPLLLVLAADHVIEDAPQFQQVVRAAMPLAEQGKLVTFGIVATGPETGYGYIRRGVAMADAAALAATAGGSSDLTGYAVEQFVEKPDLATATGYVDSGEYYWNSGMFLFRASRYLEALREFRPDILAACEQAMADTHQDMDFVRVDKQAFLACPDESVDYAVMEPLCSAPGDDSVVVMPLAAGWSDVGSWSSLWEVNAKDAQGNVTQGDTLLHSTEDCLVHSSHRLVATLGLKDMIVVETKDAVLVAARDSVQDVKHLVNHLKAQGRSEYQLHREVYRPWGKYDSIDSGERYQVKCITVKPGEKLSIQMHHHRAEHWIVVSGTARVRRGDEEQLLTENQSIYIPIGAVHSLENPGKIPLELIEVQSGSYLGEDDIVRFEDRYGRAGEG
nr:mannose-1-phosphate guanylyltransferase/mannose-6-phosphate isomerase [Marinobacterium rhizophilum]